MKIKQKRSTKKPILISILVSTLILGAIGSYAYMTNAGPFSDTNNESSSNDDTGLDTETTESRTLSAEKQEQLDKDNALNKEQFLDSSEANSSSDDEETSNTPSSDKPIIMFEVDTNDTALIVKTNLKNTTFGDCIITLTNGDTVITKSAEIIYAPEFSSCAGFSFDRNTLGSGRWNIELSVSSPSGSSQKTITYNL